MKIKTNIPIKYSLDLHLTESNLSEEGIIFEITRYAIDQIKPSELDLDNVKFTSKTLKYIFGDRLEGDFRDIVVSSIKSHIQKELIKPSGKSMYITKELTNKFFEI